MPIRCWVDKQGALQFPSWNSVNTLELEAINGLPKGIQLKLSSAGLVGTLQKKQLDPPTGPLQPKPASFHPYQVRDGRFALWRSCTKGIQKARTLCTAWEEWAVQITVPETGKQGRKSLAPFDRRLEGRQTDPQREKTLQNQTGELPSAIWLAGCRNTLLGLQQGTNTAQGMRCICPSSLQCRAGERRRMLPWNTRVMPLTGDRIQEPAESKDNTERTMRESLYSHRDEIKKHSIYVTRITLLFKKRTKVLSQILSQITKFQIPPPQHTQRYSEILD